ncbi:MAG TPA: hypothetical protein P5511_00350 [Candidatus Goldiibacteriota bacterium]|nr:hypothetical protein [Candidatus Goldiibacteriota bacterium]
MRGIKFTAIIPIILLFPFLASAAGRVDADSLRIEPSARTAGIGNAFCGVAT